MGCGGGSNTVTQQSGIPPQFMNAYTSLLGQAQNVASTPYQNYSGNLVAPFSGAQNQAFSSINNLQGVQQPYLNQAQSYLNKSTNPLINTIPTVNNSTLNSLSGSGLNLSNASTGNLGNIPQANAQTIGQYMSPYNQQVVQATQAEFNNQNAQQQAGVVGNAVSSGAWGGDRAGVAQALTAQQQNLAQAPVIAGLNNQNYAQALGETNAQQQLALNTGVAQGQLQQGAANQQLGFLSGQQQTMLGANEASNWLSSEAGMGTANLGSQALSGGLRGASAQLQAGGLQQQLGQEQLNVPYEQWLAQQSYPFQTTSFLGGLTEGLGSTAGQSASTTYPSPSTASQVAGLGLGGLSLVGATGGFGSSGWLTGAHGLLKSGGVVHERPHRALGGAPMMGPPPLGIAPVGAGPVGAMMGPPNISGGLNIPQPTAGAGQFGMGSLIAQQNAGKFGSTTTTNPSQGGQIAGDVGTALMIASMFAAKGGRVPNRHYALGGVLPSVPDPSQAQIVPQGAGMSVGPGAHLMPLGENPGSAPEGDAEAIASQMMATAKALHKSGFGKSADNPPLKTTPNGILPQPTVNYSGTDMAPGVGMGGAAPYAGGGVTPGFDGEDAVPSTMPGGPSGTPVQFNPWLAGMEAGFGMAAGTSPFAGVNIGRGMMAGTQNIMQQQQELPQAALQRAQAQQTGIAAQRQAIQLQLQKAALPYMESAIPGAGGVAPGAPSPAGMPAGVGTSSPGPAGGVVPRGAAAAPSDSASLYNDPQVAVGQALAYSTMGYPAEAQKVLSMVNAPPSGTQYVPGPTGAVSARNIPGYTQALQSRAAHETYGHTSETPLPLGNGVTGTGADVVPNPNGSAQPPNSAWQSPQASAGALATIPTPLRSAFKTASVTSGVPMSILAGVGLAESGFRQLPPNRAGAVGVMQVTPGAAPQGYDLTDPNQNVMAGAMYLRSLYNKTGNWPQAVAAYNKGIDGSGVPYADRVLGYANGFAKGPSPGATVPPGPAVTQSALPAPPTPSPITEPAPAPAANTAASPAPGAPAAGLFSAPPDLPGDPALAGPAYQAVRNPDGTVSTQPTMLGKQAIQESAGKQFNEAQTDLATKTGQLANVNTLRSLVLQGAANGSFLRPGSWAGIRRNAVNALDTVFPGSVSNGQLATAAGINKIATGLVLSGFKGLTSRLTNMDLLTAQKAFPSADQTPFSLLFLTNALRYQNMYEQGNDQFVTQQFTKSGGTVLPAQASQAWMQQNGAKVGALALASTYRDMAQAQPNSPVSRLVRALELAHKDGKAQAMMPAWNAAFVKAAGINPSRMGVNDFGSLILQSGTPQ